MPIRPARSVESLQHLALTETNVGTWHYDVTTDCFQCDDAAAVLFGLSRDEAAFGVPVERIAAAVHPDDREIHRVRRAISVRQGGPFLLEYRTIPVPGVVKWVLARGRYKVGPDGTVAQGRGILIDITESKLDGYADGEAMFTGAPERGGATEALERAARLVLATHRAIKALATHDREALGPVAEQLLHEVALRLATALPASPGGPTRH